MDQLNTLRELANGGPIVQRERSDQYGQRFIDKSEKWLSENTDLTPTTLHERWMVENSDWSFTPNNRKYYWDTVERLTPGTSSEVRNKIRAGIRSKLDALTTPESKENYFRDNSNTWPDYVHKDLEEYFFNLRNLNDRKNLEKTRLTQIQEIERVNHKNKPQLNLAPDVSIDVHVTDYIKAYDLGFNNIKTNDEGRITIPIEGTEVPVFSLPTPSLSIEEEFISLNDLTGKVRSFLSPILQHSRQEVRQSEELADKTLLNRLSGGGIPDEFHSNIIINGAILETDPVRATKKAVNELTLNAINKGQFQKPGEAGQYYLNKHKDIVNRLKRRLDHGAA